MKSSHRTVLLHALNVQCATQVTHHRSVKGHLAELSASVGIRLKQHVHVRLNEDPHRQFLHAEQDLCSSLMLSVENLDRALHSALLWCPPAQGDVQLWPA